jgi:hypothetical protein
VLILFDACDSGNDVSDRRHFLMPDHRRTGRWSHGRVGRDYPPFPLLALPLLEFGPERIDV